MKRREKLELEKFNIGDRVRVNEKLPIRCRNRERIGTITGRGGYYWVTWDGNKISSHEFLHQDFLDLVEEERP